MRRWFPFLIIPIIFFNAGCQKSGNKKHSALRCIYDQSVFAESCIKAVSDEAQFASFKREPFYSLLYQGYSFEEGLSFLQAIEKEHPSLLVQFDQFRTSDLIGNPRTFDYGKYGIFSPTTLRYIQTAGMIQAKTGVSCKSRVIQIGAGYGGLCKILHDLSLWNSYAIVDLPEHLALARKVLEREGITGVEYIPLDQIPLQGEYDLVISDMSFSEFSRSLQKIFADRILLRARSGCILGHVFPKHFGVEPFTPHEIQSYLEKMSAPIEMHQTGGERANYYLFWNKI